MRIRSISAGKFAISVSMLALAIATPSFAQDGSDEKKEILQEIAPNEGQAEEDEKNNTLVVTGSRIRRSEYNSNSPIQIIDPQIEQRKGNASTAELVQSTPLAAGSSQITSAISSNFVTNGGPGAQTISLRGLGASRTLVLMNGRRAGPAGVRGAVSSFDLNVLPQSIVERVEILKDGASSIYGSDAVAGVVNLITKKSTDGLELDAFWSQPAKKGGEYYRASATYGKDWGNASFLTSVDYSRRNELARKDRSYLDCPEEYIFREDGVTRADLTDPRTGNFRCAGTVWGHVWLYDYSYIYGTGNNTTGANGNPFPRLQFDYAGDNLGRYLLPLSPAGDPFQLTAPAGFFPVGYDGQSTAPQNNYSPLERNDTIVPKTELLTVYLQGAVNISDNIELYAEAIHNERNTAQNGSRQFWQFGYTSNSSLGSDPFAPGFTGDYLISPTAITDHNDTSQKVEYSRIVTGLRGDFGGLLPGWKWDIHGQHSNSRGRYTSDQIFQDSVNTQDFRTASCAGTLTAIRQAPCLDINWTDPQLLAGNLTQAQRAFLFGRETGRTTYNQTNAELIVNGNLFSWSQGTVAVALGASSRGDSIDDTPGNITRALRPGATDINSPASYINNAWGNTGAGRTAGKSQTDEAFGEIDIPLLTDQPFFQSLTLNAAGRITNVKTTRLSDGFSDTDKGNTTYKVSANWKVNEWLRFRSTYGTSYRAPALFESLLADQTSFVQQRLLDPCIRWGTALANGNITQRLADNCAVGIPGQFVGVPANFAGGAITGTVITGGGIGVLQPETSKSLTGSIILTPKFGFLPDTKINLAVDYFRIEVNGEISQLGAGRVIAGCYSSEFFPTDPLCSLFTRGQPAAPFAINTVRDSFLNVNSQINEGIDVSININQDLGSVGSFSFNGQMTWQLKDTVALFAGTEVSTNGEIGEPKWVGDFNFGWEKDGWAVLYGLDVIGGTSNNVDAVAAGGRLVGNLVCPATSAPVNRIYGAFCRDLSTEVTFYHTLSLTKEFKNFTISAGVSNLFDTRPPRVSVIGGPGTFGQSVVASQYDYYGRRGFLNIKTGF